MISHNFIIVFIISIRFIWIQAKACQLQSPCILNEKHGNITSTGYPGNYPVKLAWLINATHGYSVRLIFEDFALASSNDCKFDYLAVYDGPSTTGSPLLGKYCGTYKPPELFSSREQLLVVFQSDHMPEAAGFNISYEAINKVTSCSSNNSLVENLNIILQESTGTLKTELNNKTTSLHCVWKIRAPEDYGIRVTFTFMRIVQNVTCSVSNVSLYNGSSIQEKSLIQSYCADNFVFDFPIVKYIPERSTIIQLKAKEISSWDAQSFVATYEFIKKETDKCSPLNNFNENNNIMLYGNRGNVTVDSTWRDMHCKWRIQAPIGIYQIKLKFTDFVLENDCHKTYIQVFDGENMNRGKFCGPESPWVIFSTSGFLLVKLFVSGISKVLRVTGIYEAVTTAIGKCSTINSDIVNTNIQLTGTNGVIMTPNYPSHYPSNFKCIWVITVSKPYRIKLHFKTFKFEGHSCRYDYAEVRDGGTNSSATKTGKVCGESNIPGDVYSSSNKLWIIFSSDENEVRDGFLAYYSTVLPKPSKCAMVNTVSENNNIQVRRTSGFLTSPNYPQPSPAIQCAWYITVPRSSRIIIHFHALSPAPWCNDVYFAVHDGGCACNKSLGSFCDVDASPSIVSSSNALTVVYIKGSDSHFRGFNLSFHAPKSGPGICSLAYPKHINNNLYLNESSGQVTSPDYPYSYLPGTQCTWYATAPRGFHVLLTITSMNMSCYNNYLEVRDGAVLASPSKGKFCVLKNTKRIYSSGQNLVLQYVLLKSTSDAQQNPGEFVANYRMIKDGNCSKDFDESWNTNLQINSKYGIVTSPSYPRPYPSNMRCTWRISVPYTRVRLTIRHLSFGGSCSSDYLEVKDGYSPSANLLGKFCKHSRSRELQSTGKYLFMHFKSGINSSNIGFEAMFSAIIVDSKSQSTFQAVLILGFVTFAGFVVLSLTLMCIYWLCKKRCTRERGPRPNPPDNHDLNVLSSLPAPALDDIPDCLIAEDRPPSYADAVQEPQEELSQEPVEPQQEPPEIESTQEPVERGLDNPGFTHPPSYESLYGTDEP